MIANQYPSLDFDLGETVFFSMGAIGIQCVADDR